MIIKVWNGTSFETKYPNVAIGSIVASGTPSSTTALFGDGSWKTTVTSVSLASGTNNGTLKITVNGSATDNIAVKGLGSAAYTASTAYAEATHGHGNLKSGGTIVAPVTATTPTHVPIFTSDPNSTARTMNTMTLANFKGLLFSVSGTTLTITL